jgi:hypothetical protein
MNGPGLDALLSGLFLATGFFAELDPGDTRGEYVAAGSLLAAPFIVSGVVGASRVSSCKSFKDAFPRYFPVPPRAPRALTDQERHDQVLESWVGGDVNPLISSRGIPSNEYILPNGSTIYSWLWVGGTRITAGYLDFLNQAYANEITSWCRTEYTVSPSGVVQGYRSEGNACY